MAIGNYRTEFPEYPAADMPPIPATWEDASWGNEGCPHFFTPCGLAVWTDFVDESQRDETQGCPRFAVYRCAEDGAHLTDLPDLESDDWDEVLAYVAKREA